MLRQYYFRRKDKIMARYLIITEFSGHAQWRVLRKLLLPVASLSLGEVYHQESVYLAPFRYTGMLINSVHSMNVKPEKINQLHQVTLNTRNLLNVF